MKDALDMLATDLRTIFGGRLRMLAVYGVHARAGGASLAGLQTRAKDDPVATLALVDGRVGYDDLVACAGKAAHWQSAGLGTPLVLATHEFTRSIDAFPLEYGDIIRHHIVVLGDDVLRSVHVGEADLRRACEVQAKSHLIHLREGFMQAGDADRLIAASARPFATLLEQVGRLHPPGAGVLPDDIPASDVARAAGLSADVVSRVLAVAHGERLGAGEGARLLPAYLQAAEQLWSYVDAWRR